MKNEPTFEVIDRITFSDKQFHIVLCQRPGFAPQVRIKTYQIVDEEPGISLASMSKFRLRTAVSIANAIYEADDVYRAGVEADRAAALASRVLL